jgi:hypothetical protein
LSLRAIAIGNSGEFAPAGDVTAVLLGLAGRLDAQTIIRDGPSANLASTTEGLKNPNRGVMVREVGIAVALAAVALIAYWPALRGGLGVG